MGVIRAASKAWLSMNVAQVPRKAMCTFPPRAGGVLFAGGAIDASRLPFIEAHFGALLV